MYMKFLNYTQTALELLIPLFVLKKTVAKVQSIS